jgi:hypothetical protein
MTDEKDRIFVEVSQRLLDSLNIRPGEAFEDAVVRMRMEHQAKIDTLTLALEKERIIANRPHMEDDPWRHNRQPWKWQRDPTLQYSARQR